MKALFTTDCEKPVCQIVLEHTMKQSFKMVSFPPHDDVQQRMVMCGVAVVTCREVPVIITEYNYVYYNLHTARGGSETLKEGCAVPRDTLCVCLRSYRNTVTHESTVEPLQIF